MIEVRNLTKSYNAPGNSSVVLRDVTFNVRPGEVVSIVGVSGVGKSTLLRCLVGLDKDFFGSITISNHPAADYLASERIALIPQRYANFPWLSVVDNVAMAVPRAARQSSAVQDEINKLLNRVGLLKVRERYPAQLSGGMQQRVAIARALMQGTDIIALDEPFGALDVQTRSQMQEFLARLWEEEHKTMVMVTHDIDEAIYLSDRIIVLGGMPGEVREVLTVALPRPRRPEVRFSPEFLKLKKVISYMIRSEVIRASLAAEGEAEPGVLKVGMYLWSGNAPLYLAEDRGMFTQHGLGVDLVSTDDNAERVKLWLQGKFDVLNVTLDTALQLAQQVPDVQVLSVLNSSHGGDALIVHEPISTLADLRGKRIGLESNSAGHFFLLHLLHQAGLSSHDVEIINMKAGEVGAAIIAGTIDGGVLWEPWLSKARELSQTRVLASTEQYPVLYDLLLVRSALVETRATELNQFQKVWREAIAFFHDHEPEAIKVVSSCIGISEIELNESLKHVTFLQGPPPSFSSLVKDVERTLIAEGLLKAGQETNLTFVGKGVVE